MECKLCGWKLRTQIVRDEPNIEEGESGVMEAKVTQCTNPYCEFESVWEDVV